MMLTESEMLVASSLPARESLVLFFPYGISVRRWETYLWDRERLLYERLLASGTFNRIYLFTYEKGDVALLKKLEREHRATRDIQVLVPPTLFYGVLGRVLYSIVGPLIHWRVLSKADVLRTDQVTGAWTALIAKLIFGRPLLFRSGYIWSYNARMRGEHWKARFARLVERLLLRFADGVMVTSPTARDVFAEMRPGTQIKIIPNYVDVADFKPVASSRRDQPVLFVGRLVPLKNVDRLIRACARLNVALHIYGNGPMLSQLQELARELGADVTFKGVLPNREMARTHHSHSVFVLCSDYEGTPKVLIEAMASGLICIGTDVQGINELIEDGVTGYLIESPDAESISATLSKALQSLDPQMGARARAFIEENYSLERAIEIEREMIARVSPEAK